MDCSYLDGLDYWGSDRIICKGKLIWQYQSSTSQRHHMISSLCSEGAGLEWQGAVGQKQVALAELCQNAQ